MTHSFTRTEINQVLGVTEIDYDGPHAKWIEDTKKACGMTGNTGVRETWIARLLDLSPTGGGVGKSDMVGNLVLPSSGETFTKSDLKHIDPDNNSLTFIDGINTYKTKLDENWLGLLGSFNSNGGGLIYLVAVDLKECEQELHDNAALVSSDKSGGRKHVSVKADVWMNKPSTFVLYKNEALYYRTEVRHNIIKHHAQIDKLPCYG